MAPVTCDPGLPRVQKVAEGTAVIIINYDVLLRSNNKTLIGGSILYDYGHFLEISEPRVKAVIQKKKQTW